MLARFDAERQALAMMDHSNIARVYDVGMTETGRSYFAMELVHGESLTAYSDRHRLSLEERLLLFIPVCHAVQHAHQKGIIHRDLKPSNVLVTVVDNQPVPKIIDFGVAKAIAQPLTEKTIFTEQGQLIGTPEYMSPEQAEMTSLDIDTRSDIYSLGVMLYELLTGMLPFERHTMRHAGFDEIRRIIREVEPPKPSAKASATDDSSCQRAKKRRNDPQSLCRLLRQELDWIVMKTLEKDRTRRYPTALGLADDIQRYLKKEPLQAGPPGGWYQVRKFVGKYRLTIGISTMIVLLLFVGVTASTYFAIIAKRNAADAEAATKIAEKEKARAVEQFLRTRQRNMSC